MAGAINGLMDKLQFRNTEFSKKYPWFNPDISWILKWEHPLKISSSKKWYYLWLHKTQFNEKFPYSSTVLVFVTDGWHFLKWVLFTIYEIIIVYLLYPSFNFEWYWFPLGVLILKILRGIGFNVVFEYKRNEA